MRLLQAATRLRPWIAMAASYALALQMLLGGVLIGQLNAASLASRRPSRDLRQPQRAW